MKIYWQYLSNIVQSSIQVVNILNVFTCPFLFYNSIFKSIFIIFNQFVYYNKLKWIISIKSSLLQFPWSTRWTHIWKESTPLITSLVYQTKTERVKFYKQKGLIKSFNPISTAMIHLMTRRDDHRSMTCFLTKKEIGTLAQ